MEETVRHHVGARREILQHLPWANDEIALGQSHYVYTADRDDLLRGKFLDAARPTAWLYVIGSSRDPHGLAEVSCANRKGPTPPRWASIHSAAAAKVLLEMIAAVEVKFPYMDYKEYYEMRILRAPSLSLFAVWLHGDEDLIYPVYAAAEVTARMGRRSHMTRQQLEEALLPLAQQRANTVDRG